MKSLRILLLAVAAVSTVTVVGCGGGKAKGDASAPDKSAIDELKGIPAELDAEVQKLMAPIDGLQAMLDQFSALPTKLGLKPADFMAHVKAAIAEPAAAGTPAQALPSVDGLAAGAKAELDTFLGQVKQFKTDLSAVPERVVGLTASCVSMTAKVTALATQVTAEASVVAANPFAAAEAKAKAQADAASVASIQAEVTTRISATQQKITGIPGMATEALAKFMAAFAGA